MVDGLGMDLIEIARIERALDRHPRMADRLFTGSEIAYAESHGRPARHLAARFAAKEAVVKALNLGSGVSFKDIEVISGEGDDPAPKVRLSGRAAEVARDRGLEVKISLTHVREMAGAVAVASRIDGTGPGAG